MTKYLNRKQAHDYKTKMTRAFLARAYANALIGKQKIDRLNSCECKEDRKNVRAYYNVDERDLQLEVTKILQAQKDRYSARLQGFNRYKK